MHKLPVAEWWILQIAQVHRARTREGVDIVVKVQHKGIKNIILQVKRNLFIAYVQVLSEDWVSMTAQLSSITLELHFILVIELFVLEQ